MRSWHVLSVLTLSLCSAHFADAQPDMGQGANGAEGFGDVVHADERRAHSSVAETRAHCSTRRLTMVFSNTAATRTMPVTTCTQ